MSWGFKKRIKLAPGLTLNIGKKSVSARIGNRVAGVTAGTKGARVSANLPGTGLSVQKRLTANTPASDQNPKQAHHAETPASSFNWRYFLAALAALVAITVLSKTL